MTYRVNIYGWQPTPLNQLLGHWRKAMRFKRADREMVGLMAKLQGVRPATGKRRVSLEITLAKGQRAPDPDALWKSTLDALVACDALLDDNRQSVELGPVTFARGAERATKIILEDLEGLGDG